MTNRKIAEVLFNIATLLDLAQDNIYRVRAYRRAARRILALRDEAVDIIARGETLPLPGVGDRIRQKLSELIGSGSMNFYEELLEDLPTAMQSLMAIAGVGPWTARRLYNDLGLGTPEDVIQAAAVHQIRTLYGFGSRRESQLAEEAARLISLPDAPSDVLAAA